MRTLNNEKNLQEFLEEVSELLASTGEIPADEVVNKLKSLLNPVIENNQTDVIIRHLKRHLILEDITITNDISNYLRSNDTSHLSKLKGYISRGVNFSEELVEDPSELDPEKDEEILETKTPEGSTEPVLEEQTLDSSTDTETLINNNNMSDETKPKKPEDEVVPDQELAADEFPTEPANMSEEAAAPTAPECSMSDLVAAVKDTNSAVLALVAKLGEKSFSDAPVASIEEVAPCCDTEEQKEPEVVNMSEETPEEEEKKEDETISADEQSAPTEEATTTPPSEEDPTETTTEEDEDEDEEAEFSDEEGSEDEEEIPSDEDEDEDEDGEEDEDEEPSEAETAENFSSRSEKSDVSHSANRFESTMQKAMRW